MKIDDRCFWLCRLSNEWGGHVNNVISERKLDLLKTSREVFQMLNEERNIVDGNLTQSIINGYGRISKYCSTCRSEAHRRSFTGNYWESFTRFYGFYNIYFKILKIKWDSTVGIESTVHISFRNRMTLGQNDFCNRYFVRAFLAENKIYLHKIK